MKKLALTLAICLGCFGILGAQNVWKSLEVPGAFLGADAQGNLYAQNYYGLQRSQNESLNWELVLELNFVSSNFIIGEKGRLFVIPWQNQTMLYSDDNGDTWEETSPLPYVPQTTAVTKMYSPSNDTILCIVDNNCFWTTDGGMTWGFEGLELDEESQVGDMIVNAEGDVYVSTWSYSDGDAGIFHSTLSDMQNWELVAAEGINIKDMAFDPEGNVVACGWSTEGSIGFQHTPGFYLFDGTTLAISDGGIVYRPHFVGNQAILSYSTDHGEHFTDIGEHLPLVDIAPGGDAYFLIKGYDNHLYFDGGGEYWKSISDADHIREDFPYDNTRWAIYYQNLYLDWAPYIQIGIKGDTVVDGTTYHKVIKCTSYGNVIDGDCFGGIRVEADGKWYFRLFSEENVPQYLYLDMEPNTERLIYDFSLSVCDGFEYEGQYWMSVFDIDEIEINGSMRRRLWFDSNCEEGNHPYDWNWIEGIGSNFGLLYSIQAFPLDGSAYHLGEVYQNGELIYRDPYFINEPSSPEWYYEIQNENGSITYQYMYQAGDTVVQDEPTHILVKINTLYDKGLHEEITHEYVYERDGKLYWWNKTLEVFTVLYDYEAEVGDYWEIIVGTRPIDMHVDAVEEIEYEGKTYRMLHVSDVDGIFSGDIVCGIGHLTSFFPERLMDNGDGIRVDGLRCYWIEDELVFKIGDEDCDAIYSEVHGVEEDGPSTGSGTFTVYPNPTNGIIAIQHSAFSIHHSEFQIANLMGQTVLSGNINAENQQIDVSSLPQGMYFITFAGETRKFVVR